MANDNSGSSPMDPQSAVEATQESGGQSGQRQDGGQMFAQQGDAGDSLVEGNETASDESENGQSPMGTMGQGGSGASREAPADDAFGKNGE